MPRHMIIKEILADAVKAAFGQTVDALWGSGAAVANNTFPGGADQVGTTVKVPYFNSIGEWESLPYDGAFTPVRLTMSDEDGVVEHIGKAFKITDWARMASAGDPYEEAARQCLAGFAAKVDRMLIDAARAPLPEMTVDVYNAATPKTLDGDLVIDGRTKFGDEAGEKSLLIVHSKVENDLRKIKTTTGDYIFVDANEGVLSKFMGYPVGMSDRMSPEDGVTPAKYTSILCQQGALVCWYNSEPRVEIGRDILSGADVVAVSTYAVVHRYRHMQGKLKPGVVLIKHN